MKTLSNLLGWVICKLRGGKQMPAGAGSASPNAVYGEDSVFRVIYLGVTYGPVSLEVLCTTINKLRDAEVDVLDSREGGKSHHLTIDPNGCVHETYGARRVVKDVQLLLRTAGMQVYA